MYCFLHIVICIKFYTFILMRFYEHPKLMCLQRSSARVNALAGLRTVKFLKI